MSGYRRSFPVRFINRHANRFTFLATFIPCATAALAFSMLFVAILLHLGNTDTSGPVGCVSASPPSSLSSYHSDHTEDGDPAPGTIASGAGLDLLEVER
jgi:hypothetical protein